VLERNWFNWLLAANVPDLEQYRIAGVLYTKVLGVVTPKGPSGPKYPDPTYPKRLHVLALADRIATESYVGVVAFPESLPKRVGDRNADVVAELIEAGYHKEEPEAESWHSMISDVWRICQGISSKFNNQSEDDRLDLIDDALTQVSVKIKSMKLVYIPGKAPVFNLLTTTIYRIIYSILNKKTKTRHYLSQTRERASQLSSSDRLSVAVHPLSHRSVSQQRYLLDKLASRSPRTQNSKHPETNLISAKDD